MTDGYSAQQVRAAEAALIAQGVPLMARAASALAAEIRDLLPAADRGTVLLLVGAGDNGGDALFAGAELADGGVDVVVLATADRIHEAGLTAAREAGCRELPPHADPVPLIGATDVIVDGILGTGASANPALRGRARDVVAAIIEQLDTSARRARVVAVDVPSGIDPTSGAVPDATVLRADVTVTFGGVKSGLLRHPGSEFAGRVVLAEIGLGAELERAARAAG